MKLHHLSFACALVAGLLSMPAAAIEPVGNVTQVTGGLFHTCAVRANGAVVCWGRNASGQLGDNTLTERLSGVQVPGLEAAAVSAGAMHTCALTVGGGVKCWGLNSAGQTGDGTQGVDRLSPVDVTGLTSGVAMISAGWQHTCALTTGGGVKCWGLGYAGALGDGFKDNRLTPVDVVGLTSGVTAIAVGGNHTCALTTGGGVKCWGANTSGALGDGTQTERLTPVDALGLTSGVAAIASGGDHACALTTGGALKCWGANSLGELGDGSTTLRLAAVDVTGLSSGVVAVASKSSHTCAVVTGGGLKCWGNNELGQLGDLSTINRTAPVAVSGIASGATTVMAGNNHTCAVVAGGVVKCWGFKGSGALGDGFALIRPMPIDATAVPALVFQVAATIESTCALMFTGGVQCWGNNSYGQLGNNSTTRSQTPVDVSGLTSGVNTIAGGSNHVCAVTTGGGAKCWGSGLGGQLGNNANTSSLTPVDVQGLTTGVAAIATGDIHTCSLSTGGAVKCWGVNTFGQLGDGTTIARTTPVDVSGLSSGVAAIAAGFSHTCALTNSGGVKCWGANHSGQLGDNSFTARSMPTDVAGLASGVVAITTRYDHTCALTAAGGVKCWGNNMQGQVGDNTLTSRAAPVDVFGLSTGVTAIAAGNFHTCALSTSGGVKCWGNNQMGQVGDNSSTTRRTPVDVSGLASGIASIAAGGGHSCAVTTGDALKCWGNNEYAALGDGTGHYRLSPADAVALPAIAITSALPISVANHTNYTVSGTCSKSGGTVNLQIDPLLATTTCGSNGQFMAASLNVSELPRGVVNITASLPDATGDTATTTRSTTKENSGPRQLAIGMPDVINAANKSSYAFGGSCTNAGGTVSYSFIAGNVVSGTAPCSNWAFAAAGLNLAALAEGSVTVTAAQFPDNASATAQKNTSNPRVTLDAPPVITALNHIGYPVRGSCSEAGRDVTVVAGSIATTVPCGTPSAGLFEVNANVGGAPGVETVTATLTTPSGGTGTAHASVARNISPEAIPRLTNISTRAHSLTGEDVMISGFIIGGGLSKQVVVSVAGPSLTTAGIPNPLEDPRISLVRQSDGVTIATNDNWQASANAAQIQASGLAPVHPLEPALMATLPPGAYTAIITGPPGATGVAVVGVFEAGDYVVPLANISTRGRVQTGTDVMIAGFIVNGFAAQSVVVSVAGPSLTSAGITSPLADPKLTIYRQSDGAVIATNDNWQIQTHRGDVGFIQNAGFAPTNALEPAVYLTLLPGAYTAVVEGVGGTTGIGVVGVFRIAPP